MDIFTEMAPFPVVCHRYWSSQSNMGVCSRGLHWDFVQVFFYTVHLGVANTQNVVICALRFISVKGPELLNNYIGASEQAVRYIQPCSFMHDCTLILRGSN